MTFKEKYNYQLYISIVGHIYHISYHVVAPRATREVLDFPEDKICRDRLEVLPL